MVFVKVRETYDLHTTKDKMTVIAIHTPKPDIIKMNFPGLLLQCRAYRPVSADVRLACASMLPLDPLGVGTSPGDVAPEDIFNPILYKPISNKGMSQLEARIAAINETAAGLDIDGNSASVEVDSFTSATGEFDLYYSLLSNAHDWRHASPQAGLEMRGLRPLVYEMLYNVGDSADPKLDSNGMQFTAPQANGELQFVSPYKIIGKAKEFPFINCTRYTYSSSVGTSHAEAGFKNLPENCETVVPWLNVVCGVVIVPPSKLHELFFRMVVEWTLEFSSIRPLSEIINWDGMASVAAATHYQNYSYSSAKEAITGSSESILTDEACMVSSNVDVKKVM